MKRLKKQWAATFVLLVGLILSATSYAQPTSGMRPSLVAIQVENLDTSVKWYQDLLKFSVVDRKEFKDHGLSLAILQSGDFKLELVQNDKALHKKSILKENSASDMTGFAKVTFSIDYVSSLFEKLKEKGAVFAITLRDSNIDPTEQFFIVLDCDDNWLQFVGPKQP